MGGRVFEASAATFRTVVSLIVTVNWGSRKLPWHQDFFTFHGLLAQRRSKNCFCNHYKMTCSPFLVTHLSGSPVCGGVYRWPLSPVCWACLHTGTVLPASTLCPDTACERRVHLGPSTVTRPSPGWPGDSGDTPLSCFGQRDSPQAGGPPQDLQEAGSASLLASREWCGSPRDWRWSPPSPESPGNTQKRAGGSLIGREKVTGRRSR